LVFFGLELSRHGETIQPLDAEIGVGLRVRVIFCNTDVYYNA
jgi:hypothetical protein